MRKVSEILGKNIISLYEGKSIGIIENVAFDKKLKKLKSFLVYDEESENINRLFVPSNDVKIEGENAVMIKNLEKVIEDTKDLFSKKNPMNANVYNLSGGLLGKVTEVLISDDTKDIYSLILNNGDEILQTQIVSGDFKTIIIKGSDEKFPVLISPKKKKTVLNENENSETSVKSPKTFFSETIYVENKNEPIAETEKEINLKNDDKDIHTEIYLSKNEDKIPLNLRRCSAHFGFLIGRRVEYDVYNARNEKIVKCNTIITNTTLDICRKWGKLIMLARNSAR